MPSRGWGMEAAFSFPLPWLRPGLRPLMGRSVGRECTGCCGGMSSNFLTPLRVDGSTGWLIHDAFSLTVSGSSGLGAPPCEQYTSSRRDRTPQPRHSNPSLVVGSCGRLHHDETAPANSYTC